MRTIQVPVLEFGRKHAHKPTKMSDLADRYELVKQRISAAADAAGRRAEDVQLVAVSKTFEAADILPVLQAGQRVFGENRVQETMRKWPALRQRYPDVELHLIGPLQSNKCADAVSCFDVIQTVDRPKIVDGLAAEMQRQGRSLDCYVQINTGNEVQKKGISAGEAPSFVAYCKTKLSVVGLMCIPPADEEPTQHFTLLGELARSLDLNKLSMGMSSDYVEAIQCGATSVRIGSAIFGNRI